jgi:hypothetical protein
MLLLALPSHGSLLHVLLLLALLIARLSICAAARAPHRTAFSVLLLHLIASPS